MRRRYWRYHYTVAELIVVWGALFVFGAVYLIGCRLGLNPFEIEGAMAGLWGLGWLGWQWLKRWLRREYYVPPLFPPGSRPPRPPPPPRPPDPPQAYYSDRR